MGLPTQPFAPWLQPQDKAPETGPPGATRLYAGLRCAGDTPDVPARDLLPPGAKNHQPDNHFCFDLFNDPGEDENRLNSSDERNMIEQLRTALEAVDAPADQFERLGLS